MMFGIASPAAREALKFQKCTSYNIVVARAPVLARNSSKLAIKTNIHGAHSITRHTVVGLFQTTATCFYVIEQGRETTLCVGSKVTEERLLSLSSPNTCMLAEQHATEQHASLVAALCCLLTYVY